LLNALFKASKGSRVKFPHGRAAVLDVDLSQKRHWTIDFLIQIING
jgi:hypothetical protein